MANTKEYYLPPEEWEEDIAKLAKKIMKTITGYTAADAIGAMPLAIKQLAEKHRD